MELKSYQRKVLQDLSAFMVAVDEQNDIKKGWKAYWAAKDIAVGAGGVPEYHDKIPCVPHVCMKVPTGGGKTFMACCAVKPIFTHLPLAKTKMVVWLVPSDSILSQTVQNLSNPQHPYRHQLDRDFGGKVMVYTKEQLLQAQNFSPDTVQSQVSVCVLSYASLRINSRKKDDRKVFQENGKLLPFVDFYKDGDTNLENTPDTALIQVLRAMSPVTIVDESHNATSKLSVEMLQNLNPSFILELTATPRSQSNVVSYVDARALKQENMVKLPVIVFNRNSRQLVLQDAIQLRSSLEIQAKELEQQGGPYIRPIVLFQAQPNVKESSATFTKIKESLVKVGIPPEQIAIKTADVDDLQHTDLMSRDCPIRYIITVNALKEGWDCPFAYILASLANKNSRVDVEQIVGRILRQPYTRQYGKTLLNSSFVLTCSREFQEVLESIVKGLNDAGFSRKDYRVGEETAPEEPQSPPPETYTLFHEETDQKPEFEPQAPVKETVFTAQELEAVKQVVQQGDTPQPVAPTAGFAAMVKQAQKQSEAYEQELRQQDDQESLGGELDNMVKKYPMAEEFRQEAAHIKLPQFFLQVGSSLFGKEEKLLTPENLTDGFSLAEQDAQINFQLAMGEAYEVDLQQNGEAVPKYKRLLQSDREEIRQYLEHFAPEKQIDQCAEIMARNINRNNQYATSDVKNYVERVIKGMTEDELAQMKDALPTYVKKIQDKIKGLQLEYQMKKFQTWLDTGKIICKPSYAFPPYITPAEAISSIPNSLYEAERNDMDSLEIRALNQVIVCSESVLWWHRNEERKGFVINGYINHYPDFIVMLQSGRLLLVETKGDYLDNTDTDRKLKLGRAWQNKAGDQYRYFMVFDQKCPNEPGCYTLDGFAEVLGEM
jgi:type III restriction enzyme